MKKIQNNTTLDINTCVCFSAPHSGMANYSTNSEAPKSTEQCQETVKPNSADVPAASVSVSPTSPVMEFTNADTQKLDIMAYGRGKTVIYM